MNEQPPPGPSEAPPSPAAPRTGVVFCRCGPNLGNLIQLGPLSTAAAWPEAAFVATHEVLCSAEGQAWLKEKLEAEGLDRVVIAACSPREHEGTFQGVMQKAGRNPWLMQLVNLREQVEWIGGEPEAATRQATRLVRGGLARVRLQRPLVRRDVPVNADVLVVGGGAAGISAALTLARRDRKVLLVEQTPVLGGLAARLDETFPDLACASCFMEPALDAVLHHPQIEILTEATVKRLRGSAGAFELDVALAPRRVDPAACIGCGACATVCPVELPDPWSAGQGARRAAGPAYPGSLPHVSTIDAGSCLHLNDGECDACQKGCAFQAIHLDAEAETRTIQAGAIVVATGLVPGEVSGPPGVLSTYQLERRLHPGGPTSGRAALPGQPEPTSLLLASGSEGDDGGLAPRELLKLAHLAGTRWPGLEVTVAGGLGRSAGLAAECAALVEHGVELLDARLVNGSVRSADGGGVEVTLADGLLEITRHFSLLVLHAESTGAPDAAALAALLRLKVDARGFIDEPGASPFEPTSTRVAGIMVAGAAAGPRSIAESIRDGAAAAGRVLSSLVPGERRELETLAVEIDPTLCGGCGICVSTCPSHAVAQDAETGRARVEPAHCHACGTCSAACPTGAAMSPHFTREQLSAELTALLTDPAPGGPG